MTPPAARKSNNQSTILTQALDPGQSAHADIISSMKKPQHEAVEGHVSPSENDAVRGMEVLSSSSSGSWMQRIGWFKNRPNIDGDDDGIYKEQYDSPKANYHGGIMESASSPVSVEERSKMKRSRSFLTHSSQATKDSLYDFHESEWTPPDSSYGAAIPVAGCIPKHIRRAIEVTLFGFGVIGLVFLIVTTSIRVSEEVSKNRDAVDSNSEFDGGTGLDDDLNADASTYDDYFDDAFARVDGDSGLYDDYFDGQNGYDEASNYAYNDDFSRKADDYFYHGN